MFSTSPTTASEGRRTTSEIGFSDTAQWSVHIDFTSRVDVDGPLGIPQRALSPSDLQALNL